MGDCPRSSSMLFPFGKTAKQARIKCGITPEEACHGICDLVVYQAFESNQAYPNEIELGYICKRLHLSFAKMDTAIRMHQLLTTSFCELEKLKPQLADQFRGGVMNEDEMFELADRTIQAVNYEKDCSYPNWRDTP